MNTREKVLAASVIGILVLGGLYSIVKWGVTSPWNSLNDKVKQAKADESKVLEQLREAEAAVDQWAAIRPILHNPEGAATRFNNDLSQLLDRCGLAGEGCAIRPLPARKLPNEFTELRLSIQTRGTLKQLLDFMCEFYRRDYLGRLDQISLVAEDQSRRTRPANTFRTVGRRNPSAPAPAPTPTPAAPAVSGPEGPRLAISMTATALVLPQIKIKGKDLKQDAIGDLDPPEGSLGRLPRPRQEYDVVVTDSLFKEWQPQVVNTQPPPTSNPVVGPEKTVPPAGPPRARRVLAGVNSMHGKEGKLEAWVRDEDHLEQPLEKIGLNEPLDDGTLVLVHPRGVVVQVPAPAGNGLRPGFKYYFYKIGAEFSRREELDAARYPDIQHELERALPPETARGAREEW